MSVQPSLIHTAATCSHAFPSQLRCVGSGQIRCKRIGYNLNVMRQTACLAINTITVDNFAALFICTPMNLAPDSMMVPT